MVTREVSNVAASRRIAFWLLQSDRCTVGALLRSGVQRSPRPCIFRILLPQHGICDMMVLLCVRS